MIVGHKQPWPDQEAGAVPATVLARDADAADGAGCFDPSRQEVDGDQVAFADGGREVQMPFHFTEKQLQTLFSPHFEIEQMRDSLFYSTTRDEPARARLVVMRNR